MVPFSVQGGDWNKNWNILLAFREALLLKDSYYWLHKNIFSFCGQFDLWALKNQQFLNVRVRKSRLLSLFLILVGSIHRRVWWWHKQNKKPRDRRQMSIWKQFWSSRKLPTSSCFEWNPWDSSSMISDFLLMVWKLKTVWNNICRWRFKSCTLEGGEGSL